jgi:hypothetical protein
LKKRKAVSDMARYIDADALIAEYDRVHVGAPGGARKLMVDAPTADVAPRAEWISVEEKNPEDMYGKDREKITVLVCTKSGKVSASTRCARYSYDHKQNTWVRTGEFEWSGSKKVTHWMPMPNPYRGRDDQQEGMYI